MEGVIDSAFEVAKDLAVSAGKVCLIAYGCRCDVFPDAGLPVQVYLVGKQS